MEDRTFHPFPKLPKETRLLIWRLALPGSRIVLMRLGRLENESGLCTRVWSNKPNDTEGKAKFFDWTEWPYPYLQRLDTLHFECGPLQSCRRAYSPCKVPGLLLACKESFELCSNIYTPAFGNDFVAQTWLDFKKDTLYLDFGAWNSAYWIRAFYLGLLGPDIAHVENLAIRWHLYDYEDELQRQCSSSLSLLIYPEDSDRIFKIIAPFSALKKLTFVPAYHDDTEMYDLVWMDLFHVALQLEYYERPYNSGDKLRLKECIRDNNKSLDPPTIAVKIGLQRTPPFLTTRPVHRHEGYKKVHPKYKIELKIITTSQFQKRLNRLKVRHFEEQRNFTISVCIKHPCFGDLILNVSRTTTFGNLIEIYKQAKEVPEERKLCLINSLDILLLSRYLPSPEDRVFNFLRPAIFPSQEPISMLYDWREIQRRIGYI